MAVVLSGGRRNTWCGIQSLSHVSTSRSTPSFHEWLRNRPDEVFGSTQFVSLIAQSGVAGISHDRLQGSSTSPPKHAQPPLVSDGDGTGRGVEGGRATSVPSNDVGCHLTEVLRPLGTRRDRRTDVESSLEPEPGGLFRGATSSPAYSEVREHRVKGADCRAVIVEGM